MPPIFAKLSERSLRRQVADRLRESILDGSPRSGERLAEKKLATQFGVSVPVIREALAQLEAEGYVTKNRSSSCTVTQYSLQDIEEAFALRMVLESYAMREATRLASPEQIEPLEALYFEMLHAARTGDFMLYLRKAYRFKEHSWRLAGNKFLFTALRRLILPQFAFLAIRLHTGIALDLIEDAYLHLRLLEAIKSKNVTATAQTVESILREIAETARSYSTGQDLPASTPHTH